MTNKKMVKVLGAVQSCSFIPLTALPLSEQGKQDIQSGNLTYGDANRSLNSVVRIIEHTTFTKASDFKVFAALRDINPEMYIDFEN